MRGPRNGYPLELKTIADHLRKRRYDLDLIQKEAAKLLTVTEDCYFNWEGGKAFPQIQYMPKITEFLGYMPVEIDVMVFMGKVKYYRFIKGLSHKKMGKLLGVDATTVGAWENGTSIPHPENSLKFEELFAAIF